jgi:hypothetical protein
MNPKPNSNGYLKVKGIEENVDWLNSIASSSLIYVLNECKPLGMTHPQAPWWTHRKSKGEDNGRRKSWGALLGSQHFGGRRACWSFGMGTRKFDKQFNYLDGPAQTK